MAIWPVDLPQYPTGAVTVELQDSRIRSQPDTGPPLMRRRYTSAIRTVEAPMILTGAELAIFDAFYETDLLHGTQRFQWLDFRTDALVQYRFVEPPKWTTLHGDASPANRRWQATFKLEILPGLFAGVVRNIAASLTGEAVLTANAGRLLSVSATLTGGSSMAAAPGEFLAQYAAATLTGNSTLTAAALATRKIAATLTGQATLTAGAELVQGGTVNAVELDGVGQHYVMDPLGTLAPAAGSGHTIHLWRQKAVDGVEQALYWRGDITTATPVPEVSIVVRADNKVHAEWYDESGNLIGQVTSTGTFLAADGKVPIGLDISGDTATLRLKGIDDGVNAPPTAAGGYMGFGGRRYLGRSGDDGDPRYFMGCLAEDWEAPVSLGFDDDGIYEKFVDTTLTAGLAPRSLGGDGSGPSDQVLVYLNGGYATYHQNQAPDTGSVDYAPVGFIQPCADSFGVYSEAFGAPLPAVTFDGTNDYLGSNTLNGSDTAYGIISLWFRRNATGTGQMLLCDALFRVRLYITSGNIIRLNLAGQGSATRFPDAQIVDSAVTDTNWHHLIISWDGNALTTGAIEAYFDGVQQTVGNGAGNGTIDLNLGNHRIGANSSATEKFNGDMAQIYLNFSHTAYFDLTNPTNLAQFYDVANSAPRDLGADGSAPASLGIPDHYLNSAAAAWGVNDGTDADWTVNGAFTDAATSPGAPSPQP